MPANQGQALAIDGPRPCTPAELPEVIALVDAAMRAGSRQTMLSDYPLVYAQANLRNVRVLRVGDVLAAVVPVLPRTVVLEGATFRIGIISPTATAPDLRHRGYASRCLASCIQAMREQGCALSVLWTQEQTFPFYERAGYEAVRYQAIAYRVAHDDADRFPGDTCTVAPLEPSDDTAIEAIRSIHERDVDGVRRSPADWRPLLSLPKMRTLLARRAGQVVGYLVQSGAVNKPGLIEAGGDEQAIATLIRHSLLDLGPGAQVDIHANLSHSAVKRVLDRFIPERCLPVPAGMMVRINDLHGVIAGFTGTLARTIGAVSRSISLSMLEDPRILRLDIGDGVVQVTPAEAPLRAARAHLELSRREWAATLFGAHPARPFDPPSQIQASIGAALPLYFPIWVLDRS